MSISATDVDKYIQDLPDEVLQRIQFSVPWQSFDPDIPRKDADGAPIRNLEESEDLSEIQKDVWNKFYKNPQLNTSVRGLVGRLTGKDFGCSSEYPEIDAVLQEITYDWRNRLYDNWPRYVGHSVINSELLLLLTVHTDGFIEVDFVDSQYVPTDDIIYHPTKANFPLFFGVHSTKKVEEGSILSGIEDKIIFIPSIYVAKYPELDKIARKVPGFDTSRIARPKAGKSKYRSTNGYNQFIVQWNRGFGIKRSVISHLVTIIKWLNHYENLKQYEIDHKKSSGAYLWIFKIEDSKAFKLWLAMSDEDRRRTGIMAKKTPGSSLVLPPGMTVEVKNPNLTSITDQDNDILEMVSSGLNEPGDILTGSAKGTFASVKASRAPMSDRISDEIASFERFLIYDFWHAVLFLRSQITDFEFEYTVEDVVGFTNGKEVVKKVKKQAYELVDINFPTSQMIDFEAITKGLLGVKHGPVSETLGIPLKEIAKRLGINNYGRLRQLHALEKRKYPELLYAVDAETLQEKVEGGETKKDKNKKKTDGDE